uniref:Uncharacterized protein n=1 Tax=Timema monikensis TaxID=170555 RepID=A0A7R9EDB8_9NEOP|nr:unnamed protein product [Timema monikensis]
MLVVAVTHEGHHRLDVPHLDMVPAEDAGPRCAVVREPVPILLHKDRDPTQVEHLREVGGVVARPVGLVSQDVCLVGRLQRETSQMTCTSDTHLDITRNLLQHPQEIVLELGTFGPWFELVVVHYHPLVVVRAAIVKTENLGPTPTAMAQTVRDQHPGKLQNLENMSEA